MNADEIFKNSDVAEFLNDELQKVGWVFEDVISWLTEPPLTTTIRVNTLVTSLETAAKCMEDDVKKCAISRNWVNIPEVKPVADLSDVLIIESGQKEDEDEDFIQHEIIVDTCCGAAILRGAHVFAPGVIGMPKGVRKGQKVKVYADIDGKCLKGLTVRYEGRKKFVGVGYMQMERNELFGVEEPPRGVAVLMISTPSGCPSISLPTDLGLLQNLPSIITTWELNPLPGQVILDMCAAPGNKTTHIAALMENQGILIAIDRTSKKIQQITESCKKLSAQCNVFAYDSTKAVLDSPDIEKDVLLGPPFSPCSFNKILLDAPCSALGQRPILSNKSSMNQIKSYPTLQQKLFKVAVDLVKPGGEIVYSTCTITHSENEGLVAWALQKYESVLTLLPPNKRMTPIVLTPVSSPDYLDLSNEQRACVQRFGPPRLGMEDKFIDSVGFFIAKFKKNL